MKDENLGKMGGRKSRNIRHRDNRLVKLLKFVQEMDEGSDLDRIAAGSRIYKYARTMDVDEELLRQYIFATGELNELEPGSISTYGKGACALLRLLKDTQDTFYMDGKGIEYHQLFQSVAGVDNIILENFTGGLICNSLTCKRIILNNIKGKRLCSAVNSDLAVLNNCEGAHMADGRHGVLLLTNCKGRHIGSRDGHEKYEGIARIAVNCEGREQLSYFPNPPHKARPTYMLRVKPTMTTLNITEHSTNRRLFDDDAETEHEKITGHTLTELTEMADRMKTMSAYELLEAGKEIASWYSD